jgi:hypothetical protein
MLGSALVWREVLGLCCDLTEPERSLEANEEGIIENIRNEVELLRWILFLSSIK